MVRLFYRSEGDRPLYVYGAGTATSKVDFIIKPNSGDEFPVQGSRILIRAPIEGEDSQGQPDFAFINWLDGVAAVAGVPLILGGKEMEISDLSLFFKLRY